MNQDDHFRTNGQASDMPMMPQIGPVFDPKRFVSLRGRMMLVVALCTAIPAVIAAWFLVPVGYTATAQIRVLSAEPFVLNADKSAAPYEQFVSTQISLITSGKVLSDVLEYPDPSSEAEESKKPSIRDIPSLADEDDPLEYLGSRVKARRQRGSEIVELTCFMPLREDAVNILATVVDVYLKFINAENAEAGSTRRMMLMAERDAREKELANQLLNIRTLQGQLGVPLVGQTPLETGEAALYHEKLAQAKEDLATAEKARMELDAQIESLDGIIEGVAKDKPIYEFGVEDRVSADVRVNTLRQAIVSMEADLVSMVEVERGSSPQRAIAMKKLKSLKESLASVQLEVRREVLASMRTQRMQEREYVLENEETAQENTDEYQELVMAHKNSLTDTSDKYVGLEELKSKAAETRRTLEEVRSRIATLTMESKAPARVLRWSEATAPMGGPDYTTRFMAMMMAAAVSVGLAVGLGVWRELMDQQVRSTQDLARLTLLPVIATVPHAQEDALPTSAELTHLIENKPLSALADAYRHVLARMLYPDAAHGEIRSLAVVSPTRGDGKSSLTTNLGAALAQAGRSVLMIDSSYRRPTLENSLGLERDVGLVEVLERHVSLKEAIRFTSVRGLFVLGPGLESDRLAGRLASRRIAVFLEYAAEKFDFVIVDTPPWLVMADAKLVTPLVDGVVLVVGAEASNLGMVRRCLRELEEVKANVMGVVLNGVRHAAGGYMKKNRDVYYGYGHEAEPIATAVMPMALGAPEDECDAGDTDE
jgi:polysaccharide biosynthesis transport protein